MTYEMIMDMLVALGADVDFDETERGGVPTLRVDYQDFDGFDEDWCEIDRDYDDPQAVEAFQEMLASQALRVVDDFYMTYVFDGFTVVTGYASYDI